MKPAVRTARATEDIEAAVDYYAAIAPSLARRFIEELQLATEHLERHPATGSPRYAHELRIAGLRSWPMKNFPYMLFYIENAEGVLVARVLHSKRDIPVHLRSDTD